MARYRSRSRSRSYSPRRRYSRSPPRYRHYDDPRDRYRGGGGGGPRRGYDRPSAPTGLLVRNISLTARCLPLPPPPPTLPAVTLGRRSMSLNLYIIT